MANIIFIDGVEYTGDVDGLQDLKVTYSADTNGVTNVSVTSALQFNRSAFAYLSNKFFSNSNGRDLTADIRIIAECCNNEFEMILRGDACEVCFADCLITSNAFEQLPDNIAADKLLTTIIGTEVRVAPKVSACVETGFLAQIIYGIISSSLAVVVILIDLLSFGLTNISDYLKQLENLVTGCSAHIPVFLVRDILDDTLGGIGLTLQSTIFQSGTYSNAAWFDPNGEVRGTRSPADLYGLVAIPCPKFTELSSQTTANEFLEILSITFNADYRIKNGVLIFERKDYFNQVTTSIGDAEQLYADGLSDAPCYTYTDDTKYASARIRYQKDNIEMSGNTAFNLYWDRIEWNDPFNAFRKGVKEVEIPLAPSRFVGDRFSTRFIDTLRPDGWLLLDDRSDNVRGFGKIWIIEPQSSTNTDWCNAKVFYTTNGGTRDYNYPMYVNENAPQAELYQNFYSIDDPRITPESLYQLEEFTMIGNCNLYNQIITNRGEVVLSTRFGTAYPESTEMDFGNGTITLRNAKIR